MPTIIILYVTMNITVFTIITLLSHKPSLSDIKNFVTLLTPCLYILVADDIRSRSHYDYLLSTHAIHT